MFPQSLLYKQNAGQEFARILGVPKHKQLLTSDFVPTNFQHVPNAPVRVASFSVPSSEHMIIKPLESFRSYIYGYQEFTMSGALAAGNYVLDLGALGLQAAFSTRKTQALPTDNYTDVIVYEGTTSTKVQIVAISSDGKQVTVNRNAGVTRLRCYFLLADGDFVWRAVRPTGNDQAAPQLYTASFRAIHEVNQLKDTQAQVFDSLKDLAPRWRVVLETTTKAAVPFTPEAKGHHVIGLPTAFVPVEVLAGRGTWYDRQVEESLRGGRY